MTRLEKQWTEFTPEEKREERFKRWLSPPEVTFSSSEAEKAYKARVTRFIDVIKLKEPDRVPVVLPSGFFPAHYAGTTMQTVMYDYNELRRAWLKFLYEFDMDSYTSPALIFPGKVYEALDFRLYKWPGHGLPPDAPSYQFVEGEYMKADEYDAFLQDPLDYYLRYFLPRTWGAFAPFQGLTPFSSAYRLAFRLLSICSQPDFQAAFKAIGDAAKEFARWQETVKEIGQIALEEGFPAFRGPMAVAPFDTFADSLRGTKGIIMDMYRQPDKLHGAIKKVTPMIIEGTVASADFFTSPLVFMPLHKGDDVFMSDKQYETFYWPSLKKLLLGLIDEGLVPMLFAEGKYNNRLEIIKDLPRGSVVWHFDQTNMARAKEILGDTACIAGNVPTSLLCTGTPQDVKEHCRELIEICAKGGGYILTGGANINKGDPDNLRALMEAAKEFGVYRGDTG